MSVVEQHADMRSYLQHRSRILNAAPRVDSRRPRSYSLVRQTSAKVRQSAAAALTSNVPTPILPGNRRCAASVSD